MTASIDYLPIWKKGATACERLQELAEIARKHPEYFEKWVIVYCEDSDARFKTRWICGSENRTTDGVAVLTVGLHTVLDETTR